MSSSQSPVKPGLAPSDRLLNLPPYALAKVFQDRDEKIRQGVDVIDLGVGNPDMRPPALAIEALKAALDDPQVQNHRYPSFNGLPEFRAAHRAAGTSARFGVTVDPDARGAARWSAPRKASPSSCSPTSTPATRCCCARRATPPTWAWPRSRRCAWSRCRCWRSHRFLPDLAAIPMRGGAPRQGRSASTSRTTRPARVETPEFYQDLLRFAREYDLFVISDIAYCDLSLDPSLPRALVPGVRPRQGAHHRVPLVLEVLLDAGLAGGIRGRQRATRWPNLLKIKSNMDFGVFMAIQRAALAVLTGPQDYCAEVSGHLPRAGATRSSTAIAPLGYPVEPPRATLYVWLPIPRRYAHLARVHARPARPDRRGGGAGLGLRRGRRGLRARRAVRDRGAPARRRASAWRSAPASRTDASAASGRRRSEAAAQPVDRPVRAGERAAGRGTERRPARSARASGSAPPRSRTCSRVTARMRSTCSSGAT